MERTQETEISFAHPFTISSVVTPFEAGTYRLIVDEEEVQDSSFKTIATHLEIPAIGTEIGRRQRLQVSYDEIKAAMAEDLAKGI